MHFNRRRIVAFRIVHDDEVDRVLRVVMSGPALHAGAQVDQLSDLRLDDLDPLQHRQRVVPAGGIKVEGQVVSGSFGGTGW